MSKDRNNLQGNGIGFGGKRDSLPNHGLKIIAVMIGLSAFIHLMSYVNLNYFFSAPASLSLSKAPPVKIRIVEKKKTPGESQQQKQIVETPLPKTQKPKDPAFAGAQDHATEKETRLAKEMERRKAANAGQFGTKQDLQVQQQAKEQQMQEKSQSNEVKAVTKDSNTGIAITAGKKSPKSELYEKLMPKQQDLHGQLDAGYQDFVDESIDAGDRIDINTSEFRYISYFTTMRKAIELVWNYPIEAAQKGLQGEVGLEFTINKDGSTSRIKVVRSSGYVMLDKAIVDAIRLASPFSPLPENFNKPKLTVRGSFRYVLTNYAAGH